MKTIDIPFVDLRPQMVEIREAVRADLRRVFDRAEFIGGPDVGKFEAEYSAYTGSTHCIGVANGTDALELALRAVGVQEGDEVIVPANSFIATAEAVRRIGAMPVFVDVDEDSLVVSVDTIAQAVTDRTKALVPVHLYGRLADVPAIREAFPQIAVVEDAAQSHGASHKGTVSGSMGTAGATSFYPGKNLGAAGDAGAVTTNEDAVAHRLRLLCNHGSSRKYVHDTLGFNSRLDTVQAVVLRHKLRRLEGWNQARSRAARRYLTMLAGLDGLRLPGVSAARENVWHLFVVRTKDRDRTLSDLNARGIGAAIHYPVPIHLTRPFLPFAKGPGSFPVAERAAQEVLSLPLYPHITPEQQERVVQELRESLGG